MNLFQCTRQRTRLLPAIVTAGVLAAAALAASAQTPYPNRPVKVVVPISAGSGTDVVARLVADRLTKALGQPFLVENKPGADGAIGADFVAKASPDGYVLGAFAASPVVMNPAIFKLPFDPIKDLAPISNMAALGLVLGIQPTIPAKNVAELVAYAKANPGKLNYAACTTFFHLAGELFKHATDTDIVAIPYNGTAPQVTAMLSNEVQVIFDPFVGLQHFKSGRFRALAVTSATRSSLLPEIPTLQEAGLNGVVVETWIGMFAPAGTPRPTINLLNSEITKIIAMPEVRARLAGLSYEPVQTTPEQFATQIQADTARWAKTVKDSNFTVKK